MNDLKYLILSTFLAFSLQSHAQEQFDNQVNLLFGLSQIALNGYNVEVNLAYDRLIFDYSHGVSLNISNTFLEQGRDKDQGLAIHIPWTTGLGIGYRFTNWLNMRVEPKWHRFELYYDGDLQTEGNRIGTYTTFSLGVGIYAHWRPFKRQNNFLKGLMIVPSARWWPQLSSSLDKDLLVYDNKVTRQTESHKAREIGIDNSPFFYNISVGYSHSF